MAESKSAGGAHDSQTSLKAQHSSHHSHRRGNSSYDEIEGEGVTYSLEGIELGSDEEETSRNASASSGSVHSEEEEEGSNEYSYSGSGSSSGSGVCPSGQHWSYSSSSLSKSASSMTLGKAVASFDACAALEEQSADAVTKSEIRKCHGIEAEEGEAEHDGNDEEESHQKEAPDLNFIATYEEYLDHYVTSKDLYYFESDDVARTITTLGFRVPELLTREQFAQVMKEIQAKRFAKRKDDINIAHALAEDAVTCPLMQALGAREKRNRSGNMACIIYIRMLNNKEQEISGWIDFKVRLNKDGKELWTQYFTGSRKLMPRPSDLCYYNWNTFQVRYNSSENYLVTTDIQEGLQFMNKLDRKLVTVDPKVHPGDNTELVKVKSPNYLDAIIYDHFLRVKA